LALKAGVISAITGKYDSQVQWNGQSYAGIRALYDQYFGEGSFDRAMRGLSDADLASNRVNAQNMPASATTPSSVATAGKQGVAKSFKTPIKSIILKVFSFIRYFGKSCSGFRFGIQVFAADGGGCALYPSDVALADFIAEMVTDLPNTWVLKGIQNAWDSFRSVVFNRQSVQPKNNTVGVQKNMVLMPFTSMYGSVLSVVKQWSTNVNQFALKTYFSVIDSGVTFYARITRTDTTLFCPE
jgi:hypothetical protein